MREGGTRRAGGARSRRAEARRKLLHALSSFEDQDLSGTRLHYIPRNETTTRSCCVLERECKKLSIAVEPPRRFDLVLLLVALALSRRAAWRNSCFAF